MIQETAKKGIHEIAAICALYGVESAVLSPGSRCAPLTLAFTRNTNFKCYSITDERSAAFFALGLADSTQKPVVIICTSGSAVLNLAPALAEAYYRNVPIIAMTADRPPELIDIQDGQAIRQPNVFQNFVNASYSISGEIQHEEEFRQNEKAIHGAFHNALQGARGPVHINIWFREPLYQLSESRFDLNPIEKNEIQNNTFQFDFTEISGSKTLILAGLNSPDSELGKTLERVSNQLGIPILSESISNIHGSSFIENANEILHFASDEGKKNMEPEILISFGKGIVSKNLKSFLRNSKIKTHIHLHESGVKIDTFGKLTHTFSLKPTAFFENLYNSNITSGKQGFLNVWKKFSEITQSRVDEILNGIEFSDLKTYEFLTTNLPNNSAVQVANSMAIRYFNIFSSKLKSEIDVYCNRGVSGIDGSVSTAVGFAASSNKQVFIITGDLGFHYDGNALWNRYLPDNFRIIVINNSGGGIFRLIDGPSSVPELDEWFETSTESSAKFNADKFGLEHYLCQNLDELKNIWTSFLLENGKAKILEIKTDRLVNELVFKNYIKQLKQLI